jgi:hypothetical protein
VRAVWVWVVSQVAADREPSNPHTPESSTIPVSSSCAPVSRLINVLSVVNDWAASLPEEWERSSARNASAAETRVSSAVIEVTSSRAENGHRRHCGARHPPVWTGRFSGH